MTIKHVTNIIMYIKIFTINFFITHVATVLVDFLQRDGKSFCLGCQATRTGCRQGRKKAIFVL